MSYKLKSLLYLFSFIVSSIIYQNYDDARVVKTDKDLDSSQLAGVKERDTIIPTSRIGVTDFVNERE